MIDDDLKKAESLAIIVMGVSGVGKTSVGLHIARNMSGVYLEADDFHPAENIAKMSAGEPLTDSDRRPWIRALSQAINESRAGIVVASCSALSREIRKFMREDIRHSVLFLHLEAPYDVIEKRIDARKNHFMSSKLLRSQFAALEAPQNAVCVSVDQSLEDVCQEALSQIQMRLVRSPSKAIKS